MKLDCRNLAHTLIFLSSTFAVGAQEESLTENPTPSLSQPVIPGKRINTPSANLDELTRDRLKILENERVKAQVTEDQDAFNHFESDDLPQAYAPESPAQYSLEDPSL